MSNEDGKTPKKKRFTGVHKKTWIMSCPESDDARSVSFNGVHAGTIFLDLKCTARWRFSVGEKASFKTYDSPALALVAMRNRIRQRQCLQKKREQKERMP